MDSANNWIKQNSVKIYLRLDKHVRVDIDFILLFTLLCFYYPKIIYPLTSDLWNDRFYTDRKIYSPDNQPHR